MSGQRETRRRGTSGLGEEVRLLLAALAGFVALTLVWLSWAAGTALTGGQIVWHPLTAVLTVMTGRQPWPWPSTIILVLLLASAGWVGWEWWQRRGPARGTLDSAARTMQQPARLGIARYQDNAAAAHRLLAEAPQEIRAMPGPPLGITVAGGVALHVPAELGVFIEAGTRTGKTMAWAVPAVMAGWGPVLATSNKPDLYRHTAVGRARRGRNWLSDPQGVTGAPVVEFWVNLLRAVRSMAAARKLASFFVDASRNAGDRVDSYFDGGAQELLACYLLAAATAQGDLLHVAEWLGRDQDQTPALILKAGGHLRPAQRVLETQALYARQRDGLFDMARRFLNVLSDDTYARMITPPRRLAITAYETGDTAEISTTKQAPTHQLPEFSIENFVTSTDTLYALSMAGPDSAAPLSAALVGQILEAALTAARKRPDGRLAVPLLGVLDEAANCCPIAALPNYYTYAGGHGVVLMTFIQVREQGEDLWGANGLNTIRAQAIQVYGGGIGDTDFLQQWSALTGDHDVADHSTSTSNTGTSRTKTWRAEPILAVAELAALPKDRALIRLPGHKPVLVQKVWWQDTEYRDLIQASLDQFTTDHDRDADDGEPEAGVRFGKAGTP